MEVILLERVEKLGQMGDVVRVKPGFARNYLLPEKKALRATKENIAYFETQRTQLEAVNLDRRKEAETVGQKLDGLDVTLIRQAGDTGQLYGSVTTRDIADALIEAGVAKVYVGCRDPHPFVAGGGIRRLRRAGIEVETGVLEDACREVHRGFLSVVDRGRPFVTLKLATSLDGRIATATATESGGRLWRWRHVSGLRRNERHLGGGAVRQRAGSGRIDGGGLGGSDAYDVFL